MSRFTIFFATVAVLSFGQVAARAEVLVDTVTVGNPGNFVSGGGLGGVDYVFRIGKFEVTAGQYTEFLNAVATTDAYGLYDASMADTGIDEGCNIQRTGSSGSFTYTVADDWANRPVNYVSWGDAVRFVNWLYNGQPAGPQNLSTTEDGSYYLNGATTNEQLMAVVRKPDAFWVIPSGDEWHKAAFHKNDGVTDNWFRYTTSSDNWPSNDLIDPDPGNNVNFHDGGSFTIGSPYWRTEVGEFENSASPYGTFDQGGNVGEWTERPMINFPARRFHGGTYAERWGGIDSGSWAGAWPMEAFRQVGFRVAVVSDSGLDIPAVSDVGLAVMVVVLLAVGAFVIARRQRPLAA